MNGYSIYMRKYEYHIFSNVTTNEPSARYGGQYRKLLLCTTRLLSVYPWELNKLTVHNGDGGLFSSSCCCDVIHALHEIPCR